MNEEQHAATQPTGATIVILIGFVLGFVLGVAFGAAVVALYVWLR